MYVVLFWYLDRGINVVLRYGCGGLVRSAVTVVTVRSPVPERPLSVATAQELGASTNHFWRTSELLAVEHEKILVLVKQALRMTALRLGILDYERRLLELASVFCFIFCLLFQCSKLYIDLQPHVFRLVGSRLDRMSDVTDGRLEPLDFGAKFSFFLQLPLVLCLFSIITIVI